MSKSTRSIANRKPAKPYPDFPLYAHNSGRWAKKVRGRTLFFGRWGTKDGTRIVPVEDVEASARAAKIDFDRQWPYISEGRSAPKPTSGGLTMRQLINDFLNFKRTRVDSGELKLKTFQQYHDCCAKIVAFFGRDRVVEDLRPDEFLALRSAFGKRKRGGGTLSPAAVAVGVRITRMLLKYSVDTGLLTRPIAVGPGFREPSKEVHRRHRQRRRQTYGRRMFEPHEVRALLEGGIVKKPDGSEQFIERASQPMRAFILLAVNCGFGQSDLANLPKSAINLDTGWIVFPRPKTAADRRCPLWPETIEAVQEAIDNRPAAGEPDDEGCVFLTRQGRRFVRSSSGEKRAWVDSIGLQFGKLMRKHGLDGGRAFYAFRHGFETVAGESKDQMAVDLIMGHAGHDMARLYMEGLSDERLLAVTDTVRAWLWKKDEGEQP